MKVIGLIPFKNEEHFLPTYLSNVKRICDEIIAVDDHSTDNSRKIMEQLEPGEKVRMQWLALWKSCTHFRNDYTVE